MDEYNYSDATTTQAYLGYISVDPLRAIRATRHTQCQPALPGFSAHCIFILHALSKTQFTHDYNCSANVHVCIHVYVHTSWPDNFFSFTQLLIEMTE